MTDQISNSVGACNIKNTSDGGPNSTPWIGYEYSGASVDCVAKLIREHWDEALGETMLVCQFVVDALAELSIDDQEKLRSKLGFGTATFSKLATVCFDPMWSTARDLPETYPLLYKYHIMPDPAGC